MTTRINIHGPGGFEGWFDRDSATGWAGRRGEMLWHATGGRWVLSTWATGGEDRVYRFITADQARDWLERNDLAAEPALLEPRPPGRPEIGGEVRVRLGGLLPAVDELAARREESRAGAVRYLVERGLTAEGIRHESAS